MKYGKNAKVLTFPKDTVRKTDSPSSKDTTTEQSQSRKVNSLRDYYREEWPKILGSVVGTFWMFAVIYFAAKVIHG